MIENISWNNQTLAYIITADTLIEKTTFITPPEFKQQVGFVVYPAGGEIVPHIHLPIERHIMGTSEVLLLRKGLCLVNFYNDLREPVATRELKTGDVLILVAGGHGFCMLEDTIFIEIKQGPYAGQDDKERFQP
jgi:hypothetical protein